MREELLLAHEGGGKGKITQLEVRQTVCTLSPAMVVFFFLKLLPDYALLHPVFVAKRRTQRALDAERVRLQKEELMKKVDSCQRRSQQLKEKYCRMLKVHDIDMTDNSITAERPRSPLKLCVAEFAISLDPFLPSTSW